MKEISLTQGKVALVDNEDYEWLSKWKWYVMKAYSGYYARTTYGYDGMRYHIYMHRLLMLHPSGLYVDHINHDGLDNRKENLRRCLNRHNQYNRRQQGKSRYPGVKYYKNRWIPRISIGKKRFYLGSFKTEVEARVAHIKALEELDSKVTSL